MKKTALLLLSIASIADLAGAGIVTATPFSEPDTRNRGFENLIREAGSNASDVASAVGRGKLYDEGSLNVVAPGFPLASGREVGLSPGGPAHSTTPLTPTRLAMPEAVVPEGGSTLLLLGAGILAVGLLRRRAWQHSD